MEGYVVVFTEYLTRWPEATAVPISMLGLSQTFSLRRFWRVMELPGLFFPTEKLTFYFGTVSMRFH